MTEDNSKRGSHVRRRYDRLAPDYDRRWSEYVSASTRETLRRLELRPMDRVLDIGCGTGELLSALTPMVPQGLLVGVDLSQEMLGIARRKLGDVNLLISGDVHALPLPSGFFDLVVSSSSFHYWDHPVAGLSEIARVLRTDGRLVVTDWCDDYIACRVCDRVLRWIDPSHRRSYSRKECERLLREGGFEVKTVERYKINWIWGLMTAAARRETV